MWRHSARAATTWTRSRDLKWETSRTSGSFIYSAMRDLIRFRGHVSARLLQVSTLLTDHWRRRGVFALTGLGATVTSVDISENQLEVARQRASELDLDVLFIRSDVTHIPELESNQFDLVFMGGVAIFWFSNLEAVCREAARILLPGGRAAWLSGIIIPSPLYGRRTSRDLKSSILISTVAQGFSSTDSAQNTTCTIGQSAINSRP